MEVDAALLGRVRALLDGHGLIEERMFGAPAFSLGGHVAVAMRPEGLVARLGKGNDGWALAEDGVSTWGAPGRTMPGWVVLAPSLAATPLVERVMREALTYVLSLPPKPGRL